MKFAWVAGQYVPEEEAKISIFDRGVVIGDGVFETVFATQGIPEFFDLHYNRLEKACKKLKLGLEVSEKQFREIIQELCGRNTLDKAAIRITLTRGLGLPGLDIEPNAPANIFVTARPIAKGLRASEETPVTLCYSQYSSHQASGLDPSIKSTNYLVNIMAKHEAAEKGFDDALFLGAHGSIAEVTTASIFFVRDNTIITPSFEAGILPGITRQIFLENIKEAGLDIEERLIMPNEVTEMDEAFITSSLRGAKSISKIEDTEIPKGSEMTEFLKNKYFEAAKRDQKQHLV